MTAHILHEGKAIGTIRKIVPGMVCDVHLTSPNGDFRVFAGQWSLLALIHDQYPKLDLYEIRRDIDMILASFDGLEVEVTVKQQPLKANPKLTYTIASWRVL